MLFHYCRMISFIFKFFYIRINRYRQLIRQQAETSLRTTALNGVPIVLWMDRGF